MTVAEATAEIGASATLGQVPRNYNFAAGVLESNLAAGRAKKPAYIDARGSWTYGQLADRVARFGAAMRGLGIREGIWAAVKADTASLAAWQLGMYGWMAIALFVLFSPEALPKSSPVFWFMMQIAMFCGLATSFPVNWWLLRRGLKEAM